MTKRGIVLSSLLIFASAGAAAYVSNRVWGRCNVSYTYHADELVSSKSLCCCILPQVDQKVGRFSLNVDCVSHNRRWLRFTLSKNGLDTVFGFMHRDDSGKWQLVDYGTDIEDEDMDRYAVPGEIRPGYISAF